MLQAFKTNAELNAIYRSRRDRIRRQLTYEHTLARTLAELGQLHAELEELRAEKEQLHAEKEQLRTEREKALAERERLRALAGGISSP